MERGHKSAKNLNDSPNNNCFADNTRDSGTDSKNSILFKTKTVDAESCQTRCQFSEGCEYFLYLTKEHPQWYKRRECRLLRHTGILVNEDHHVSGPKHCNSTVKGPFEENNFNGLNQTFIDSNIFKLSSEQSNTTSRQNLTILVDDFLTQICRFQVFSGKIKLNFILSSKLVKSDYLFDGINPIS